MSRNRFQRGMHVKFHGREYVLEELLRNGDLRMRDVELDQSRCVGEAELVGALFDGHLFFLGDARATDAQRRAAETLVDDLNMLEDGDPRKVEAKRRWAYVGGIVNGKSVRLNAVTLVPLIERVHREIKDPGDVPHWRTVLYRWFKPYLACGEDPRALVPNFKRRGSARRRFSGKRKGKEQKFSEKELQLASEVAGVVEDVINEEYLTPQRLSVQEVYDKLENRVAEKNQLRDPDDQLPVPHRNSIYRIVSRLDPYEKDRARFGKRYADNRHRCNRQGPRPTRPLERAEIDHTRLDLFVVDEDTRMPLGRPTLTTLLDKFSREVLGVNVGFDPPSYLSVMQCLNHAIKPKTYIRTEFPEVKNEWEAYGLPEVIVVDNGKEFRSKDFEDACLQLGIVVMYSPPYVPRYKGSVERFFGTENRRLLHQQRGTTFSNIFERHGCDPQKNAVISFDALMKMLHVWIVDVYHQSYHRGLRDIPAHVWREGIKRHPPALPGRMEDLRVLLGHVERRVVGPSGIELFTLFYNCGELARLRHQANAKDGVVVKYDPGDLSVIHVYDRQKDKYIAVPAVDQEYTMGLSLWQHRVIQSNARRDVRGRVDIGGLRAAKKVIQEIVEAETARRGKAGAKSKVARWENVRQPNYDGHLDVPRPTIPPAAEVADQNRVLINPDAKPFSGISRAQSAGADVGSEDAVASSADGVIDLTSETEKRRGGKRGDGAAERGKRGGGKLSAATESPRTANPTAWDDDGEDLDMTGFEAGYNLPGKGVGYERQPS